MEVGEVDLHMHSIFSDGSNSPRELLNTAKQIGITKMALTEHDNIEGSKELMNYNNEGVYLYSGVELTARVNKGRMHILGYNIDLNNERLNQKLKEMKEASLYNLMLYIEVLKKDYGLIIPKEDIEYLMQIKGNVGRPQLALILIKLGYCTEVEEAFQKYLKAAYEKVRKIKKGLIKEECVDLILKSGGVVSLAHPSSLKMDNRELESEIAYLKSLGMQSIEVIHINNNIEQRIFYHELAKKYDLLESGGTDYHGYQVKPDIKMGTGRNGNVDIRENSLTLTKNIKSRYM